MFPVIPNKNKTFDEFVKEKETFPFIDYLKIVEFNIYGGIPDFLLKNQLLLEMFSEKAMKILGIDAYTGK